METCYRPWYCLLSSPTKTKKMDGHNDEDLQDDNSSDLNDDDDDDSNDTTFNQ